ncbi:hypothetical protein BaRGS_00028100 [Batillaria attramentaria]|uniref:F5/8 type C domain-containing protein n=1 Tax=Batillaria attramentaria TaxID=370345 RepID=A0ABD0K1A5_9CAEN
MVLHRQVSEVLGVNTPTDNKVSQNNLASHVNNQCLLLIFSTGLVFMEDHSVLAFRATAGVGVSAYERYVATGSNDDSPLARSDLPCGCLTVNGSLPCDRHYRSRILDDWPSSSIDTVRLTLYENGVQQRFVEFDGSGSNFLNWFTQARVVNSDWTDISNETANFFSIAGVNFPDVPAVRRFYINRSFGQNCDDQGWLLVAEADDVCDYVPPPPYPVIIYSGATTSTGVGMIT